MLKPKDTREAGMGLADKGIGLAMELAGVLTGSDRLKDAGRTRQDAGTERLMTLEEEAKATRAGAEAQGGARRQKRYQHADERSAGRRVGDQPSAGSAVAEKVKGGAKKVLGSVAGNEGRRAEGEAQTDKANAQGRAVKHETKAATHREKAEAERRASDRRAG